jgi:hypothetical protein
VHKCPGADETIEAAVSMRRFTSVQRNNELLYSKINSNSGQFIARASRANEQTMMYQIFNLTNSQLALDMIEEREV